MSTASERLFGMAEIKYEYTCPSKMPWNDIEAAVSAQRGGASFSENEMIEIFECTKRYSEVLSIHNEAAGRKHTDKLVTKIVAHAEGLVEHSEGLADVAKRLLPDKSSGAQVPTPKDLDPEDAKSMRDLSLATETGEFHLRDAIREAEEVARYIDDRKTVLEELVKNLQAKGDPLGGLVSSRKTPETSALQAFIESVISEASVEDAPKTAASGGQQFRRWGIVIGPGQKPFSMFVKATLKLEKEVNLAPVFAEHRLSRSSRTK